MLSSMKLSSAETFGNQCGSDQRREARTSIKNADFSAMKLGSGLAANGMTATSRATTGLGQSDEVPNVSQRAGSPSSKPLRNQRTR